MAQIYWELKKANRIYSSLTTRRLQQWISEGRVTGDDFVRRSGFNEWMEVGRVEELKPSLKVPQEEVEE